MTAERKDSNRVEKPLFDERGFVDLDQFEGFLPKKYWELDDKTFALWANEYASVREGFETPTSIVSFQEGEGSKVKGKLSSGESSENAIVEKRADLDLEVEAGVPYVVEYMGERFDGKRSISHLKVKRRPTYEDLRCYEKNEGVRIRNLFFRRGKDGKVVARLKGRKGKFILTDKENKVHPKAGEFWLSEIDREEESYCICRPILKDGEPWTQPLVFQQYDNGLPSIYIREYKGWSIQGFEGALIVETPEELERSMRKLPQAEKAILARLWNIYWEKELSQKEAQEAFKQEVELAQFKAWQAYKQERVSIDGQVQKMVDQGGLTRSWRRVVVENEDVSEYDINVDVSEPAIEAWRRYGDLGAVTAAEAYKIATDDDRFVTYLRKQEEIDLHLEELRSLRPETAPIYVGNLKAVVENYKEEDCREVARSEFHSWHQVESREIENDLLEMELLFVPAVWAREIGSDEEGEEGMFSSHSLKDPALVGEDGKVYEVEYTLAAGEVKFRDGFYDLPDHLRDRIADICARELEDLRESSVADKDSAEKVGWKKASNKKVELD